MALSKKKTLKILIVDDDADCVSRARAVLTLLCNATVDSVSNGSTAIVMLTEKNRQYDVMLLEVLIPEVNGIEVCKILFRNPCDRIPVILVSTLPLHCSAFRRSLKRYRYFSFVKGLLEKPFSDDELIEKVKHVIRSHS